MASRSVFSLLFLMLTACGGGRDHGPAGAPDGGGDGGGTTGTASDMPCEVSSLLATYCIGCHGDPPIASAPMSLMTLADLMAPDPAAPAQTVAEASLGRMRNTAAPMPPHPMTQPTEAEIAAFEAWVTSGGTGAGCDTEYPAMPNPYDTPDQCTSDMYWTLGDRESPFMHPGTACIECHAMRRAPQLLIGGTVYDSAHQPDDCEGTLGGNGPVDVLITDAEGTEFRLPVNNSGNFFLYTFDGPVVMPYTAKVVTGDGLERAMHTPQMDGDCNTCHNELGTMDAPGRILRP